ncbi:MAG: DsrE family protein [Deinococcales bacterium]
MTVLLILNDPPYGTERSHNGLRLALQLAKQDDVTVHVFLMADAVGCARAGQVTADGYHNLERMLRGVLRRGAAVGACGTCLAARGLDEADLLDGVSASTMDELGRWVLAADRIVTF